MDQAFPLQIGGAEAFGTVREFLRSSGYSESFLLQHFQLPSLHFLLYPYGLQREYFAKKYQGEGVALLLARLLFGGYRLPKAEVGAHVPADVVQALLSLGILESVGEDLQATVLLYPAFGFFVTADRAFRGEDKGYWSDDYVMSGAENVCRQFMQTISVTPCKTFLDMGTGAGLAALLGTQFSEHVWAVDITERAVKYAEFNKHLNGVTNLTVLRGDLFEPVRGMKFERIVANPPFEPPLKRNLIFSVGGEDGEAIIARLIQEVPEYLEPGGRVYCQVLGTDREGDAFDQRVRRWLGAHAQECDIAMLVRVTMPPNEYAIQQILGDNADSWKLQEWNLFYHKLKATQVVLGHLILQKRAEERPTFQVRRDFGPHTNLTHIDWLVDWETRCMKPGLDDLLLASHPAPGSGWELHVRHVMKEGKLTPLDYTFYTQHPFQVNLQTAAWMAALVSRCDGKKSGAELYAWLKENMKLPPEEFLKAMCALVSCDFLRIEGFAPPMLQ